MESVSTASMAASPIQAPSLHASPPPPKMRDASPRIDTTIRPTAHLPPHAAFSPSEPDDDKEDRTIKITINIVIPKLLVQMIGTPKKTRHRFLFIFIGILYLSFMVGQAAAWGITAQKGYNHSFIPILAIATFVPYVDLLANIWIVQVMKKDKEEAAKGPSFRDAFVLMINTILLVLQIVILGFAASWADYSNGNIYYWAWVDGKVAAVAGLTIYSMSCMIIIKLILAFLVFRSPGTFDKFQQVAGGRRSRYDYDELAHDEYDEDARIRPGMRVSHNDQETPRNSTEQAGRILLL